MLVLLGRIYNFLTTTGTTPTRPRRDRIGDPRFALDLRSGREPHLIDEDQIMASIEHEEGSSDGRR